LAVGSWKKGKSQLAVRKGRGQKADGRVFSWQLENVGSQSQCQCIARARASAIAIAIASAIAIAIATSPLTMKPNIVYCAMF
jgi:hypothetical protein